MYESEKFQLVSMYSEVVRDYMPLEHHIQIEMSIFLLNIHLYSCAQYQVHVSGVNKSTTYKVDCVSKSPQDSLSSSWI